MKQSSSRWFFVIPPDGAARVAAVHAANAFKQLVGNNNIKLFDTYTFLLTFKKKIIEQEDDLIVDLMNQSLVVSCLDFETKYLISGALSPITLFTLLLLQKQHITTIHWFYEDFQRAPYWQSVLRGYNHFCSIQKGPIPELCNSYKVAWHFLPTAVSVPPPEKDSYSPREIDVAFIGIPSNYRIRILEHIVQNGFKVAIAGIGWHTYKGILQNSILSTSWTNEQQTALILQKTKIGINLSVDDPEKRENVHVSPRVFDILISQAVCLTEETSLLHETIGKCTVETFSDSHNCIEQIKTILMNYTSYDTQNKINSLSIQSEHTYLNRAKEIISFVS